MRHLQCMFSCLAVRGPKTRTVASNFCKFAPACMRMAVKVLHLLKDVAQAHNACKSAERHADSYSVTALPGFRLVATPAGAREFCAFPPMGKA